MSGVFNRSTSKASLLAIIAGTSVAFGAVWGCSGNLENLEPTAVLECGRLSAQNEEGTLCQPLVAPSIKSQDVEFASLPTAGGQTALKGTLTLPDWGAAPNLGKKLPGIVLVAGEGPTSRDGLVGEDATGAYRAPVAVFQDIAEGMSRRGYAVMRYDKRTCTPDINPMCTSAPEIAAAAAWGDLVGDAVAAAKFMGTVPEVDSQDIILLGFSQGATVAVDAASQIEGLSEVILLAGVFDPIDSVMVRRINWRLEAFADTYTKEQTDALQKELSLVESGFMAIKEGYMPAEERFFGSSPGFWKDWIAATTMTGQNLQQLNRPLFYMRGSLDQDASEADQAGFTAAMAGLKTHKVVTLADHNHALVRVGEDGQVSEECTRHIAEWLGRPPTGALPTIERLD
jgi:dienelactone hydrolase